MATIAVDSMITKNIPHSLRYNSDIRNLGVISCHPYCLIKSLQVLNWGDIRNRDDNIEQYDMSLLYGP